ncbi:MAG: SprT-like domain-containing protein [Acidimicrobiales bacterium]
MMTTGSLAHAGAALWGPAGAYLYAAYERLQSRLFPELPPELPMVIGLTAYGHCIGLTRSWPSGARISVAPKVFAEGARMVDDVLVHEMLHVWLMQTGLDHKHAGEPWYPARYYIGPAIAVATY